jgi:hypothetical protein
MSLNLLWKQSREELEQKQLHQIIAIAGDGKLLDESPTSEELREFLRIIPSAIVSTYVTQCLATSFGDSGLALQDLVNEIGRRLGFKVQFGRYRGKPSLIGFDGLWRFPDGHCVIVEVKTTDTYRIDSNTIAGYRRRLIESAEAKEDQSSILIVVGRQDTGDLEAQIRGSRNAWDIRLISVDALLRLMRLKESVDDPQIVQRICSVLIPREYTRLDEIVEIAFFAAEDAKADALLETVELLDDDDAREATRATAPVSFHEACIDKFAAAKNLSLIRQSRTSYTTVDRDTVVVCAVSKAHDHGPRISYWFAFHPYQKEFLESASGSYLLLGCGSANTTLVIPYSDVKGWLDSLWTTVLADRMYWHIRLKSDGTSIFLNRRKGSDDIDVTSYLLQ